MRLCRFNENRIGLVEGDALKDVTSVLERLPAHRYPLPRHDPLIASLAMLRPAIEAAAKRAKPTALADIALLSPVANPGKVVAAPVNYAAHLKEVLNDPGIHHDQLVNEIHKAGVFLKAPSSVVGPSQGVKLRFPDRRNDYEVELAVVIGKAASRVAAKEALAHVAGYTIGLDMTLRGPEERSLRKSIDSYTVFGPWLVTADEIPDPGALDLALEVNGELRQQANTRDLILSVPTLIAFVTSFYTLHPGDVLMTGTPQGVGPVRPGDVMTARIERIGEMVVRVGAA
jgi:2-keto-4-pentenoate hydratase/2-oxohepta-3-ene-1,7-dioic acid hydratase in catechol pathway